MITMMVMVASVDVMFDKCNGGISACHVW